MHTHRQTRVTPKPVLDQLPEILNLKTAAFSCICSVRSSKPGSVSVTGIRKSCSSHLADNLYPMNCQRHLFIMQQLNSECLRWIVNDINPPAESVLFTSCITGTSKYTTLSQLLPHSYQLPSQSPMLSDIYTVLLSCNEMYYSKKFYLGA